MNQLTVIEYQDLRVLTTTQLAESFGTDTQIITNNFNRNKERYSESKHYVALEGQEKRNFINQHQIDLGSKNASVIYLWTEKGAWLHAKSLNTDRAWEAYEMLVDDYYSVKQSTPQLSGAELIAAIANQAVAQEKRLSAVEAEQERITEVLSLNPTEWRKKVTMLLNKLAKARGGDAVAHRLVRQESYDLLQERAKCKLGIRVNNIKSAMALEGLSKSKINGVSRMDAIAQDARLTEIYLAIIKEMAIGYKVDAN